MRPYRRQHHGQSGRSHRPQGQRYRPPMEYQGQSDPDYIAYLRQKAAHYSDRLAAFSIEEPMPPSLDYATRMYTSDLPFQPPPTTHQPNITPSPSSNNTRRRNPARERSKHRFYAVRNGLEGNEIYTSWRAAAPHCYNTQE